MLELRGWYGWNGREVVELGKGVGENGMEVIV